MTEVVTASSLPDGGETGSHADDGRACQAEEIASEEPIRILE